MNFRKLIEQAMGELRTELDALIARKLSSLMGDGGSSSASSSAGAPRRRAGAAPAAKPGRPAKRGGRTRARPDHMDSLRAKVVSALKGSEPMKKAQILKAAKLPAGEGARVGNVLKRLKDEGVLSMQGTKGSAIYTYKGS